MRKNKKVGEYDIERIKKFMVLPAEEKLKLLEGINRFFDKTMSERNKRISQRMRKAGW